MSLLGFKDNFKGIECTNVQTHWLRKKNAFSDFSTIDFDGFQDSLKEMVKKKYQDETNDANAALKKLEDQIIDNAQDFIGY